MNHVKIEVLVGNWLNNHLKRKVCRQLTINQKMLITFSFWILVERIDLSS